MRYSDLSHTSLSLLEAARQDDPVAWKNLCDVYSPLILAWIQRAGLQEADAADLSQDVLSRVHSNLVRFRKERPGDTYRGWLWTITRNEIRGWFRRQMSQPDKARGGMDGHKQLVSIPDWITDDSTLEDIDPQQDSLAIVIRNAAELVKPQFEPQTWQAFWRATVEGDTSTEIAADLQMTTGAVRQAKFRVLAKLKKMLPE